MGLPSELCPKCGSRNTYQQDGENHCMMCGSIWSVGSTCPAKAPAAPSQKEEIPVSESKKKPCRNCGRVMTIPCDGLCGGCYGAVYGKHEKGTPEYDKALADAKARFTDPNYDPHRRKHSEKIAPPSVVICMDNSEKAADIPVKKMPPEILNHERLTEWARKKTPLQDAFTRMPLIVDKLRAERDFHSAMIEKINKAIEILQP